MALTRIQTNALQSAITSGNIADGTIVAGDLASGAVTAPKLAAGSVENYMATYGTNFMFRNKLMNGDMSIAQRTISVPYAITGTEYTVDRWRTMTAGSNVFSVGKNLNSITPPAGFNSYYGVQTVTPVASNTSNSFQFQQFIEALNTADLAWGTASAKAVTLSFWVRSSVTGEFPAGITNAVDYSYTTTYTINSANTWEYKTITIPGPTAGTWDTTSIGRGIDLHFNLGSGTGTTVETTVVNQWQAAYKLIKTTSNKLSTISGATWYITGVQLEVGTVATPFERRPFGVELALCQRYCHVWSSYGQSYRWVGGGFSGTNSAQIHYRYPVIMRAAPSVSFSEQNKWIIDAASGAYTSTAIEGNWQTNEQTRILLTVASGVTANWPIMIANNGDAGTRWIRFDAEL